MSDRPHLTLVDPGNPAEHDLEFLPLPYYPWDERPATLALDADECATAIHLSDGDVLDAARLLKVPIIRLNRMIRHSPRLQRILDEALGVSLVRAAHVPLATLRDPTADARRLEWASTKLLHSRLARDHPLAPAPAATLQSSVTVNPSREIVFRWKSPSALATDIDSGAGSVTE